ncbi:rhodanese-like domain-containing protein [Aquimarina mytili]|uniref:Rhodanese-like domain-containing protein n=1 Tax=Aquimarina mytili TaxID=874423 RepID=A0A936ZZB7_9FLAO|nr:rhodanese-like domain-containing protein [Aquimarina mytili]MBL0682205.1 rhodanese-like domain-containing protein [Aquimarina mytili]
MKFKIVYIFLLVAHYSIAQNSLDEVLKQYNNESIPYIYVDELKNVENNVVLLDAREKNEYEVSHIKNAKFVGYTHFKIKSINKHNIPKSDTIVVYCSLGVRSEDISEKLKKAGYINVYNLYGGIFEWKNKNYTVVNSKGEITENVHACSKQWAKWLQKGKKVYSN